MHSRSPRSRAAALSLPIRATLLSFMESTTSSSFSSDAMFCTSLRWCSSKTTGTLAACSREAAREPQPAGGSAGTFQTPHREAATARPGARGVKPQTSLGKRREATAGFGSCHQTCQDPFAGSLFELNLFRGRAKAKPRGSQTPAARRCSPGAGSQLSQQLPPPVPVPPGAALTLNTSLTACISSGPTPSPGSMVTWKVPSGLVFSGCRESRGH